jgi:hypothetical protein
MFQFQNQKVDQGRGGLEDRRGGLLVLGRRRVAQHWQHSNSAAARVETFDRSFRDPASSRELLLDRINMMPRSL